MKIVISGVNFVDGGPLKVFKDAIMAFSKKNVEIVCLVNDMELFDEINGVRFLEFPHVKKRWINRIFFEYWQCIKISSDIRPDVWVSMHDMTPNIKYGKQFVYCHNPSPFYKAGIKDFKYSLKFCFFTFFYKYLYRINIKKNTAIITQQSWMAEFFVKEMGVEKTIVSKPNFTNFSNNKVSYLKDGRVSFFYPALPRTFKNFELLLDAFLFLKENYIEVFERINLYITLSPNGGKYERYLYTKYGHLSNVNFLGMLSRDEVNLKYNQCDVVVFPSKLETWGLPITEACSFNKPIFLANLPYAHETIGDYNSACFIDTEDFHDFALKVVRLLNGEDVFYSTRFVNNDNVFYDWGSLVEEIMKLSK